MIENPAFSPALRSLIAAPLSDAAVEDSPAQSVTEQAAEDVDLSNTAIRTVTTEAFTLDRTTLEVVCTRNIVTYAAEIEWTPDVFDMAMRFNIIDEIANFYRFVRNTETPNTYIKVINSQETVAVTDSEIYTGWANRPSKKDGYTKGNLLDAKLVRLRRLRNEIDLQKGRLRALESATRAPHGDGAGEFTVGSAKEIAATQAAIATHNDSAIKLFHGIEQALAHLNTTAVAPVVSRWIVVLPSPLGELTVLNPKTWLIDMSLGQSDAETEESEED